MVDGLRRSASKTSVPGLVNTFNQVWNIDRISNVILVLLAFHFHRGLRTSQANDSGALLSGLTIRVSTKEWKMLRLQ